MAKLREVTSNHLGLIENACLLLKEARDQLRTAGANNAAAYVARSLKSAEGAKSHAERALRQARNSALSMGAGK